MRTESRLGGLMGLAGCGRRHARRSLAGTEEFTTETRRQGNFDLRILNSDFWGLASYNPTPQMATHKSKFKNRNSKISLCLCVSVVNQPLCCRPCPARLQFEQPLVH